MSETAQGSVRDGPRDPSSWEDLLDPAVLKARLEEARLRRERALAQRAAAGEDAPAASQARADRIRTLDRTLAGKPDPVAGEGGPVRAEPRPAIGGGSGGSPAPVAPAPRRSERPAAPGRVEVPRAETVRVGRGRLEDVRPAVRPAAAPPSATTMPERLATVIVRPAPAVPAGTVPAEPAAVAAGGRRLPWPALLLGLLVGAACMVLAIWWGMPGGQAPVTETGAPPAPVATAPLALPDTAAAVPAEPALTLAPLDRKAAVPAEAGGPTVALVRGPTPDPLGSPESAATAAVDAIASGTALGMAPPRLRFAATDPEAGVPGGRGGLVFAGGPAIAALVDYPIEAPAEAWEDDAPDDAPAVPTRRARAAQATPPVEQPAVAAPPAAQPPAPAQTDGMRSTLERAVESKLRSHLLGK